MRIAILNWTRLHTGGVETYLGDVIPGLVRAGHEVAFWHETHESGTWNQIVLPEEVATWWVEELGRDRALTALRDWRPHVLYSHNVNDPEIEARALAFVPGVFFAHGHFGTCVSGLKTLQFPTATPCQRHFGWQCLLHYYPRRCGGLNPRTMWRDFRRQTRRLALLHDYAGIVVASEYMKQEYLKHGLPAERLHQVPLPVHGAAGGDERDCAVALNVLSADGVEFGRPWRLLYAGRMDRLKGGGILLEALPHIRRDLKRALHVTFAGDGPERGAWERQAARLHAEHPDLTVEFPGWQNQPQIAGLHQKSDLIVVPSLLPETFGLVGPEAGLSGVPAAAFAVGGITSWLTDGVNGHVAPADPPTAAGLARAVVRCLADPPHYARLRRGAVETARRFTLDAHLEGLLRVFASVGRAPGRVRVGP